MPYCINHPDKYAVDKCPKCGQIFCSQCLTDIHGINYCEGCIIELRSSGVDIRGYPKISILRELRRVNKGILLLALAAVVFFILTMRLKIINSTLSTALYQKSEQIISLDRRVKAHEDKIRVQEEKLNKLIPERQALQSELDRITLELNSLHIDAQRSKSLADNLRVQFNAQNEIINSLKKRVQDLTSQNQALKAKVSLKPASNNAKSEPAVSGNKGFIKQSASNPELEKKVVIEVLPSPR